MKARPKKQPLFDNELFSTEAARCFGLDLNRHTPPVFGDYTRRYWEKNFVKKFLLPGDKQTRRDKAIAKFLIVNEDMRVLNQRLCPLGWNRSLTHLTETMGKETSDIIRLARHLIHVVLGDSVDTSSLYWHTRHSSGASVGVSYKDTSLEAKWTMPLTYCGSAASYLTELFTFDPSLLKAVVEMNYPFSGYCEEGALPDLPLKRVKGSKATTVPKTNDVDRFICVEPTVNILLQQGLAETMWDRMETVAGLSRKRDPEKHRKLAFLGSIHREYGTIDFESMSDRVSIAVVHKLFPSEWAAALMDLRSPYTLINGEWVENHMISSMGNATTFPVETLTLWALAVASTYREIAMWPLTLVELNRFVPWFIGTFGDDVILRTADATRFIEACSQLGFVVNKEKSFYGDEYFRESCGGDFYHGRDVRPLFLKAFPSPGDRVACEAHLYTMINRTIQKYIQYFGPLAYVYDKSLLRYLYSCLNSVTDDIKFVPEYFPEDSGVCCIRDAWRHALCYTLRPSKVAEDRHGGLRFRYLRWKSHKGKMCDDLRYAVKLKQLPDGTHRVKTHLPPLAFLAERVVDTDRTTREFGKYVVAVHQNQLVPIVSGRNLLMKIAKRFAKVWQS